MDVTKCPAKACPIKTTCYRYSVDVAGIKWEAKTPGRLVRGVWKCSKFYRNKVGEKDLDRTFRKSE